MSVEVEGLPRQTRPNVDEVLESFLNDQQKRLSAQTISSYEAVVQLLRSYLNGYAYQGLSRAEARRFDRFFNAEGKEHREFCQLFGPEKILENLGGFLGDFIVRKVMAGEDFKRTSGTVARKLSKWLGEKRYVSEADAGKGERRGAIAARQLVDAERAARLLQEAANRLGIDTSELPAEDYVDFDHFTIIRVEPGRLWLEVWEGGRRVPGVRSQLRSGRRGFSERAGT